MNPMQPNPAKCDTYCFLVHGWRSAVSFDDPRDGWQALADIDGILASANGVLVVAYDLINNVRTGAIPIVIGLPVGRAHANDGPVSWSIDEARAIEGRTASVFSQGIRDELSGYLTAPLQGDPHWLLVPTGSLASGYCTYGTFVNLRGDGDEDTQVAEGNYLIYGVDMHGECHQDAVEGLYLAKAMRWSIQEVDLSVPRCEALASRLNGGYYLIARHD